MEDETKRRGARANVPAEAASQRRHLAAGEMLPGGLATFFPANEMLGFGPAYLCVKGKQCPRSNRISYFGSLLQPEQRPLFGTEPLQNLIPLRQQLQR